MRVDINKFWIQGVLEDAYPNFQRDSGADLDHNGQVDSFERFGDLDGNGIVGNRRDYQLYLRNHREALSANVEFFRWGDRLSVENRIHQEIYLEADLVNFDYIREGYDFISNLVASVNTYIGNHPFSREQESQIYYQQMRGAGIRFTHVEDPLLLNNIHGRLQMDCALSSFIAIAIGDERGLSLNPVLAPKHLFLRGTGNHGEFNVDFGILTPNSRYSLPPFHVTPDLIQRGIYLYTLNDEGMEAISLENRGDVLERLGRRREALAAFDRAIQLNPNDVEAHFYRGFALERLNRPADALMAYDRALQLNPSFSERRLARDRLSQQFRPILFDFFDWVIDLF